MIETVAAVNLMVEEVMKIKKNRLTPEQLTGREKRICIVSGIYGDELQGQYVCYELLRRIKEDFSSLTGIVDVYPALNPLGLEARTREIPGPELEMNGLFPGSPSGVMGEYAAFCVFAICLLARYIRVDYGMSGVLMVFCLYLFRKYVIARDASTAALMYSLGPLELWGLSAILIFHLYNGERGNQARWLWYVFYPTHMLVLGLVRGLMLAWIAVALLIPVTTLISPEHVPAMMQALQLSTAAKVLYDVNPFFYVIKYAFM